MKTAKSSELLWETLVAGSSSEKGAGTRATGRTGGTRRLPYDRRCVAVTRTGRRCRARICKDSEFCSFHQPEVSAERRRTNAAKGGRSHHRLTHLPDGYLRNLTTKRAVGDAMDRLYREVRLGLVTPDMGAVLFKILTRILDSGLAEVGATVTRRKRKSKAERIRPLMNELLTREERRAWRKAVENAPVAFLRSRAAETPEKQKSKPARAAKSEDADSPVGLALTAAS